jgi:hypothetical protein
MKNKTTNLIYPLAIMGMFLILANSCKKNNDNSNETPTTYTIGQTYGGGRIFYIDGTGQHGLISATTDQSIGAEWGCQGNHISTSMTIGAGQANTTAIVTACYENGIAARICSDLVLNGYNDWFLPSKDELNQMYQENNVISGFSGEMYWSSSEGHYSTQAN